MVVLSSQLGIADPAAVKFRTKDLTADLLAPPPSDSHPEHRVIRPQSSINLALPVTHLKRIYDSNGFGDCAPQPAGGLFVPADWSEAGQSCLRITQGRYNAAASRHFLSDKGTFGAAQHPSSQAKPAVLTAGLTERILEQSLQGFADARGAFFAAAVRGKVEVSFSLFASDEGFDRAALARKRRQKSRYVVVYGDPEQMHHRHGHDGGVEASNRLASSEPFRGLPLKSRSLFAPRPAQKHLIEVYGEADTDHAAAGDDHVDERYVDPGMRYHLGRSLGLAEPVFSGLSGKIERDANGNFADTRVSLAERSGSLVFTEFKPFQPGGAARSLAYGLGLPFGANRLSVKSYVSNQPTAVFLERRLVGTNVALSYEPRASSFKLVAEFLL